LNDRARDKAVQTQLQLYPADAHVFHLFWSFLPEAADALQAAGRFVRARTDALGNAVDTG
jgi:epsilon-lactone hydrolase